MTLARRINWLVLLLALVMAIAWLVTSIVGLTRSATQYHVSVLIPQHQGTSRPSVDDDHKLRLIQNRWGISTMFAIFAVALVLVLIFVHGFLHDRRGESRRIEYRE